MFTTPCYQALLNVTLIQLRLPPFISENLNPLAAPFPCFIEETSKYTTELGLN